MNMDTRFRSLKNLNLRRASVSLVVVREYKRERVSHYTLKYVQINESLENRLRRIVTTTIGAANSFEEYSLDCPEPEGDQVRTISYTETDFQGIFGQLSELNPEEDIIDDLEELIASKAYVLILRNRQGIQVVGFKTIPENWKMKQEKGLIPLLFRNNRFEDLVDENVFSISNRLDFIYYDESLFILSKKEFERGLNFREGMIQRAEEMYVEARNLNIFLNMDVLTNRVGNNQRYLRKIATIKKMGHYREAGFIERMRTLCIEKGWNIQFDNGKIVFTDNTLDDILTLLQNKRLHSELTDQDFDVESAKPIER